MRLTNRTNTTAFIHQPTIAGRRLALLLEISVSEGLLMIYLNHSAKVSLSEKRNVN